MSEPKAWVREECGVSGRRAIARVPGAPRCAPRARSAAHGMHARAQLWGDIQKIHLLHEGWSLCPLSATYGLPCNWPKGHLWISIREYEAGGGMVCEDCKAVYGRERRLYPETP